MTAPDAYDATWLLAIIRDDPTGLDLKHVAAQLGCEPDVDSVTEALRMVAEVGEERGREWEAGA